MAVSRGKTVGLNPGVLGTDREAVNPTEYLKTLLFLIALFILAIINRDVFKQVCHDDSARPNVHRLVVMFFVDYHFGRPVQPSGYMGRKPTLSIEY